MLFLNVGFTFFLKQRLYDKTESADAILHKKKHKSNLKNNIKGLDKLILSSCSALFWLLCMCLLIVCNSL